MISILFVLAYFLFIIVVIYSARVLKIQLLTPNIPGFFIIMYLIFGYLGTLTFYFNLNEYRVSLGITDQELILKLWFYSMVSLVLVIVGFFICVKFFKWEIELNDFTKMTAVQNRTKILLVIVYLISLFVFIIYLSKLPSIPLIELIKGTPDVNIKELRNLATTRFSGKYHWYSLFFNSILTFITFILFAEYLVKKNKLNLFLFLLVFLTASFAALVPTHKAPFMWLIIGLVFTFILVKGKKLNAKLLFSLGVTGIIILVLMFKHFMGLNNRNYFEIINIIFSRLTTGQLTSAYFYLELFPEKIDYLYGRTFPNPGGILPWTPYPLTIEVANYINPNLSKSNIVPTAPAPFWGEMYVNFGIIGIVVSSLFVGLILYAIQYYVLKMPLNSITIGLNSWLIIELHKLALKGLSSVFMDIDLIIIIIISVMLIYIDHNKKVKINNISIFKNLH